MKDFLDALRTDCTVKLNPASALCNDAFESEFRSKLLTHHCFMGAPLFQESFEAAFRSAVALGGASVEPAPSGQRFWDVQVDGKRFSLKSSKAKSLKQDRLHISKLTEAAWIQDCRTAKERQQKTHALFREYCEQVDAIVQLRYFHASRVYELTEMPISVLQQVLETERKDYVADGPSINIPVGKEPPDFTLKLDRSDAKVTLSKINKDVCLVHAMWQVLEK